MQPVVLDIPSRWFSQAEWVMPPTLFYNSDGVTEAFRTGVASLDRFGPGSIKNPSHDLMESWLIAVQMM